MYWWRYLGWHLGGWGRNWQWRTTWQIFVVGGAVLCHSLMVVIIFLLYKCDRNCIYCGKSRYICNVYMAFKCVMQSQQFYFSCSLCCQVFAWSTCREKYSVAQFCGVVGEGEPFLLEEVMEKLRWYCLLCLFCWVWIFKRLKDITWMDWFDHHLFFID